MAEIRLNVAGASPAQPPTNQISIYAKASDKRLYVKDDSGAEVKLVTTESTLSGLNAQTPLTTTGGSNPTIAISNVSQTEDGAMAYQDKIKLDNATSNNAATTLVQRDALGNVEFNKVTANTFEGQATSVQTIPALVGDITSNGSNNATTISSGVINNDNIASGANIQLTKLEILPTDRSNHIGSQTADTISDFDTAIDSHLTSQSSIVNEMINDSAGIELSKLETNPLDRNNHTGVQTASSISDFTDRVNIDVSNYLDSNKITNVNLDDNAGIEISKLETDPLDRANHTGTQLASTISDFNDQVPVALTAGQGIDGSTLALGTIDVIGTPDRIDISAGNVDIDANYEGQTSITTVGTISTGNWEASVIPQIYGGTGTTSPGEARNNLLDIETVTNSTTIDISSNVILADATNGIVVITLPNADSRAIFTIKKIDSAANNVVISAQGGETIEGANQYTLTNQYEGVTLVCDENVTWYITSKVS